MSDASRRWGLALPAVMVITLFSILPLGVVILYSLLTPGDYGNVKWIFSGEGWFSVLFERDMFDDTVTLSDAHISILLRSVGLSLATTALTLVFGAPAAWFGKPSVPQAAPADAGAPGWAEKGRPRVGPLQGHAEKKIKGPGT